MLRTILLPILALVAVLSLACSASDARQGTGDPRQEVEATVAFWQARIESDPADFVALGGLGAAQAARARLEGDVSAYAAARQSFEAAIAGNPGDAGLLVNLGFVHTALHDFAGALTLADNALALEPSNAAAHALRGDALLALGRYGAVEAAYLEARRLAPGLETTARLALYRSATGRLGDATLDWHNALAMAGGASPVDAAWAFTEAARFSLAHGNLDEAGQRLGQALRSVPGYVPALAAEADLLAARGDRAAAIEAYTAIVTARPAVEYLVSLGELLEAAGDAGAASAQFAVVDGIDELYVAAGIDTDLAMARFHVLHGDPARALELARRAHATAPTAQAADVMGLALMANGQPLEAIEFARTATRLAPTNAILHGNAAVVVAAAGDWQLAGQLLGRAMELNPVLNAQSLPRPLALALAGPIGGFVS
jgi:tetratricopeptide (TPR) repeat protein